MPDPTTPKYDEYGIKTTQAGYDWEERMMDGEFVAALRGSEDDHDPRDSLAEDDRDYYPPDLTLECQSCHKRWTDDREDVFCPYCDSGGDHLVVEEEPSGSNV